MRWIKWIAVVTMFVIGFGAIFVSMDGLGGTQAATTEFITQTARLTNVAKTSAATGTVTSAGAYSLAFGEDARLAEEGQNSGAAADSDWMVAEVMVAVGDRVAEGQTLATVSTTDLELDIANTVADLELAQMKLAEAIEDQDDARTEAKRALFDAKAAVTAAELTLKNAEVTKDDAADGNPKRQARIAVIRAEEGLRDAKRLRDDLEAQLDGDFPDQQIAISEAELAVADLEAALADLDEQRQLATLVSPVDAIVSAINIDEGFLAPGSDAIELVSSALQVVADVVESDVSSLAIGQTASVTIDALDLDATGTVTSIAPSTGGDTASVVTFPVTVTLNDVDPQIKAGMSADVEITIAEAAGVVAVPAVALRGREGTYAVQVVTPDGGSEPRPVTVGLVTETLAEIQTGVFEGEDVVVGTTSDRVVSADQAPGGFGGGFGGGLRGLQGGGGGRGGAGGGGRGN